jgi:hypothetical protein
MDSGFPDVELLGQDIVLGDTGREFQLTVVDVPGRVVMTNQAALDLSGEGGSPEKQVDTAIHLRDEVDASHTEFRGVLSAQGVWSGLGDDLGNALGPSRQVQSKPSEVRQDMVYFTRETYACSMVTLRSQNFLEHTEKSLSVRDGEGHWPELVEQFLPLLHGRAALRRRDGIQEFQQTEDTMGRELDGHGTSVKHPAENNLPGGPSSIALQHLLDRCWFLSVYVVCVV